MAAERLREYVATWLETIRPTVRHNTIRAYEQTLRVRAFPVLGDVPIDAITRPQLKVWFAGLLAKYKPATAAHALITLHTVLNAAVEDELLVKNPAGSLRMAMRAVLREKRGTHRPPLTREQLAAFLEAASQEPETYPAMMILAFTGVRIGEAVGLQWDDVDVDQKLLRVRRQVYSNGFVGDLKSGAGLRVIPMAEKLATVLLALRTERKARESRYGVQSGLWVLFPDLGVIRTRAQDGIRETGTDFTANMAHKALARTVRRTLARAGLPITFSCHSLRHTVATLMVEQGANLKFVQNLMGHASISITADRYARSARMMDSGTVETFSAALTPFASGALAGKENA